MIGALWFVGAIAAAGLAAAAASSSPAIEPLAWDDDIIVIAVFASVRELGTSSDPHHVAQIVATSVWPTGHDARDGKAVSLSWPPRRDGEQRKTWTRLLSVVQNLDLHDRAT